MNLKNYEKQLRQKFIPNLLNSVLVTEDAPYHNKQVNPAPASNSRRNVMTSSLLEEKC
jgi:hypothetical protein